MKTTIAIILSLLPLPAAAQYYEVNPATNPTIYAPPTTYQSFGTTTYGSDGFVAQQYGNTTYITLPNPAQPQVVCQTFGTVTSCQ